MGNQQCNRHLHLPGQHHSFQGFFPDFSIPMIIFKAIQGLENFYITFQDFPYFSRICTNPEKITASRPKRLPKFNHFFVIDRYICGRIFTKILVLHNLLCIQVISHIVVLFTYSFIGLLTFTSHFKVKARLSLIFGKTSLLSASVISARSSL